jgi:rhodanese-related sulfurtransferase
MKHKITFATFLFLFTFYAIQCRQTAGDDYITAEKFLSLNDTTAILLDVRTKSEYQEGHLENSILMNLRGPDFAEKVNKLDKDKTYYVYCRSGMRSRTAVNIMRKRGFLNAYNIKGGIIQLTKKGAILVK